MTEVEIGKLTDKQLHELCRSCGSNIRKLQKEFAGYLHEVARRGLHKRFGFYSLYEYAGKLAGISHAVVDEIMAVHKKLEDKPILKELIAEQGWTKLKIIASSATPENQRFWAEKVREMSKSTLETYVRELRKQECSDEQTSQTETGSQGQIFTDVADVSDFNPGICNQMEESPKTTFTVRLDSETETELRIFKLQYEKRTGEPQDWNQVMKELLKIAEDHEGRKSIGNQTETLSPPKNLPQISGRHIPAKVKKYLIQKHEGRCAYPGCNRPSEIYHHTKRFALYPNHDPDYLIPLCKDHERLAHHGMITDEEKSPENWKIKPAGVREDVTAKTMIDHKVNSFRKPDG